MTQGSKPERQSQEEPPQKKPKLGRVSQLMVASPDSVKLGKSPAKKVRGPRSAPIVMQLNHYSSQASDIVQDALNTEEYWQLQLTHDDAYPSITFGIINRLRSYIESLNEAADDLNDFLRRLGVRLSIAGPRQGDRNEIGYEQWRIAFYVRGGEKNERVTNFISFLDEFLTHLQSKDEFASTDPFTVQFEQQEGMEWGDIWTTMVAEDHFNVREVKNDPVLGVFSAAPPFGEKIVKMYVQEEEGKMQIVFLGDLWDYRARFNDAGIDGTYLQINGEEKYVRAMQDLDVSLASTRESVEGVLGSDVLKFRATLCIEEDPMDISHPVGAFLQECIYSRRDIHKGD